MKKLAIAGKSKSGKDTTAKEIKNALTGYNVEINSFADPIKKICSIMFPQVPQQHLFGASELRESPIEGLNVTVRTVLTEVGKLGRQYDKNCWLSAAIKKFDRGDVHDVSVGIISDLRFKNEMKALKEGGFLIARVYREGLTSTSTDISELDLDDVGDEEFDFIIHNDKDIDHLRHQIEPILSWISQRD